MYRNRCFLDFKYGKYHLLGRIIIELFIRNSPKTCENFRSLCTGQRGLGKLTRNFLWYKGSCIQRIIPKFMFQMGDFSKGNGRREESSYECVSGEDLSIKHDRRGLISMANLGYNNGSQIFFTFAPIPYLDGKNVVFGHIIEGMEVLDKIETIETSKDCPIIILKIANSGELVPRKRRISRFFSKGKLRFENFIEKKDEKVGEFILKKNKTMIMKKILFGPDGRTRRGRGFFRYKIVRQFMEKNKMIYKEETKQHKNYDILFSREKEKLKGKIDEKLHWSTTNQCSNLKRDYSKKRNFSLTKSEIIFKTNSIISRLSGKNKK